jgi:hypothetical protein
MVVNRKFNTDYASNWEFYGESSETKPTMANGYEEGIPDKSLFMELDTGEGYYYNKDTDSWAKIGG